MVGLMRKILLVAAVALAPITAFASGPIYGPLQAQNALSELGPMAPQARLNLGLGSAAVHAATDFDAAGAAASAVASALAKSNNLSDVPSPSAARTNLGLGSAATQAASAFDAAGAAAAAQAASVPTTAVGTTVAPLSAGVVPSANLPVGTASGTVAAGNDSRITGALQTSSAGPLATQAGANSAAAIVGAIGAVHTVTASGSYTVLGTDLYVCINKATPAPTAVLLPSTFNQSSLLNIKDCSGNAATYPITLTPASGTIDGNTTVVMSVNYEALTLSYNGSGWSIW
jgi:hypothetical protein